MTVPILLLVAAWVWVLFRPDVSALNIIFRLVFGFLGCIITGYGALTKMWASSQNTVNPETRLLYVGLLILLAVAITAFSDSREDKD